MLTGSHRAFAVLCAALLASCEEDSDVAAKVKPCIPPKEQEERPPLDASDLYSQEVRQSRSCARRVAYQFGGANVPLEEVIQAAIDQCDGHVRLAAAQVPNMAVVPEETRDEVERGLRDDLRSAARFHALEVRTMTCPSPAEHALPGAPSS